MDSNDQISGAPTAPEIPFVRDDAFRLLLRVRYGECDMQKVVFNARYFDYVDIAITEYIRRVWGSPDELLNRGMDYQAVHQSIDWKTSARADDILAIVMDTAGIGRTSFTIHSGVPACRVKRSHRPCPERLCADRPGERRKGRDPWRAEIGDRAGGAGRGGGFRRTGPRHASLERDAKKWIPVFRENPALTLWNRSRRMRLGRADLNAS